MKDTKEHFVTNLLAFSDQVMVISQVLRIPHYLIRPFAGQPRDHFDPQQLHELAASLKVAGQITPVIVRPLEDDPPRKYELVDGQRRWIATEIAGIPYLDAILNTDIRSAQEQYESSAIANFCKAPHTPIETMKIMIRFRDATNPARSQTAIAQCLGCNQVTVSQYLSLENLLPEILMRLRPDTPRDQKISFGNAVKLGRLPQHLQERASKLIVEQKLGFRESNHLIQRIADQAGVRITRASHSPRDDYRRFDGFLNRTESDATALTGRAEGFFRNMFLNRPLIDRQRTIFQLDRTIEELRTVKNRIEKETSRDSDSSKAS